MNSEQGSGDKKPGTIVCSWCKKVLGTSADFEGTSHGICPECKAGMIARVKELTRWEVEVEFRGVAKVPVLARTQEDAIALVNELKPIPGTVEIAAMQARPAQEA
jgi:phage FluMu protein Com